MCRDDSADTNRSPHWIGTLHAADEFDPAATPNGQVNRLIDPRVEVLEEWLGAETKVALPVLLGLAGQGGRAAEVTVLAPACREPPVAEHSEQPVSRRYRHAD